MDSQEIRPGCAIRSGQEQEGVGWLAADEGKLLSVATSHTIPVRKGKLTIAFGGHCSSYVGIHGAEFCLTKSQSITEVLLCSFLADRSG